MILTFKRYLECIDDTYKCLESKYGQAEATSAIKLYNSRYVEDLSYKYKVYYDIDDMSFGQFVTAEEAYNNIELGDKAILQIATSIIRPKDEVLFDNTDDTREEKHRQHLLEENAKDVIEVLNKYVESRNDYIHVKFKGVFYSSVDDDDETSEEDSKEDTSLETTFTKLWYWHQIKDLLAGEDITKHPQIEDLPMYRVSPHLAYLRYKNKLEYKRMKDAEMKQRIHNIR